MLLDVIGRVDYDISKQYHYKTTEEPDRWDDVKAELEGLIDLVELHMKKATKKFKSKKKVK